MKSSPKFRIAFLMLAGMTLLNFEIAAASPEDIRDFVGTYCTSCHNPEDQEGDIDLKSIVSDDFVQHEDLWRDVFTVLDGREMPPLEADEQPTEAEYESAVTKLDTVIQRFPVRLFQEEFALTTPEFAKRYCVNCHSDEEDAEGGFVITDYLDKPLNEHSEVWEHIARRIATRQMPPAGRKRPSEEHYGAFQNVLEAQLDTVAEQTPNPGHTESIRRLSRTEYQNAIRDLLGIDIDAGQYLPADDESFGFDNTALTNLSPLFLEGYVTAAQAISKAVIGRPQASPSGTLYRVPPDVTQDLHVDGLPLGTRGGAIFPHLFPNTAEYELEVRLTRDRNEHIEGLLDSHELVVLIDRKPIETFTIERATKNTKHISADAHLKLRIPIPAGQHDIGVTFVKKPTLLGRTERRAYDASYNYHRHPRQNPAVYQLSVLGPFNPAPAAKSAQRAVIIPCATKKEISTKAARSCAQSSLKTLARKAYRRTPSHSEIDKLMRFYDDAAQGGDFDAGMEASLAALLVSPKFIFRIEDAPQGVRPGEVYALEDLDLASRLAFFLWSSLPDDELLNIAERGDLRDPAVLAQQVDRMLKDPRSKALAENFAPQWLKTRNLATIAPDSRLYPDFDDNLRQAFQQETTLFFDSILRENLPISRLIDADYTYLNERLATHYDIPNIRGSHFRRVDLPEESERGGILRHGGVLTVTSYPTRTSPVLRGDWVLETMLGTPTPPPPPDIPAIEDVVSESLPMRERLAQHRADPACASCHRLMDPIGFAMENFDAIGRWRDREAGRSLDTTGGSPSGETFTGVNGLEQSLLARPELFAHAFAEKLLTYATGRGVHHEDGAHLRQIVRKAETKEFRFSAIVTAVVESSPFSMRIAP